MTQPSHPCLALGGVFLSLFGATWLVGASYQYAGISVPLLACIALLTVALASWSLMTFFRRRATYTGARDVEAGKRIRKSLMLVNITQWSIIGLLILLLNVTNHVAWIMPGVIFVVGVHFLPLAHILQYRGYYLTALGLVLVAVIDSALGVPGHGIAVSLLATGAILWASAFLLLSTM